MTSVELLALAAIGEGRYAQGFPSFGPERRGAPVEAFNRINDTRIKKRQRIYRPDVVVVLDPGLISLVNVSEGLKPEGLLIINTGKSLKEIEKHIQFKGRIALVDATAIAWKELKIPITNTTMLGALVKMTDVVKLESLNEPIEHRFGRIANRNLAAMKLAYDEVHLA